MIREKSKAERERRRAASVNALRELLRPGDRIGYIRGASSGMHALFGDRTKLRAERL